MAKHKSGRHRESHYLGGGHALTRTRFGHLMIVPTRDMSLGMWLMLEGSWEEAITRVFRRALKPGMTVVDVGANVGWYTLLAAEAVGPKGRVIAFEPDPEIAGLLRDNVELNGFEGRVEVHQRAVSDRSGTARFYARSKHRGNGSLVEKLDQLGDASAETHAYDVSLTTLDALRLDRIDVMKVDAEGSEAGVFRGAHATLAAGKPCLAIVEFWPIFFMRANEDPAAFLEQRREQGFRLGQVDKRRGRIVPAEPADVLPRGVYELVFKR